LSQKYIESTVKANELKIIPLGDIHYGDPCCNKKLLKGTLDYIKTSKNTLVIGMGDYLNCATTNSVSDTYDSQTPQTEYEEVIELLTPIKHKMVGLLMGNHEQRIRKESGWNVVKTMSKELGIPYLGWGVFWKISVGTNPNPRKNPNYVVYATHGASGASTPEGKLRAVRKLSESFEADLYLQGHVHDVMAEPDQKFAVDKRKRCVKSVKSYYVITGHFLNYQDSYAEMKAMKPSKTGVPKIKLFGDRWDIHVSL